MTNKLFLALNSPIAISCLQYSAAILLLMLITFDCPQLLRRWHSSRHRDDDTDDLLQTRTAQTEHRPHCQGVCGQQAPQTDALQVQTLQCPTYYELLFLHFNVTIYFVEIEVC